VALAYLAAPTLWQSLAGGHLGAAVTHATLPWLALACARAVGADRIDVIRRAAPERPGEADPAFRPGDPGAVRRAAASRRPSLGDAALAGLLAALACAGTPLLLPLVAVLWLVVFAATRCNWRLVPVLVLPLVCFARLIVAAVRQGSWRLLLADPGLPVASETPTLWRGLLGFVTAPLAPDHLGALRGIVLASGALVPLVALAALWRRGRHGRGVRLGWAAAVAGLAGIWVAARVPTAVAGPDLVTPWAGGAVSLVLAGLLAAAACGADGAGAWLVSVGGARRIEAGVLAAVMFVGPAAILGAAAWQFRSGTEIAVVRQTSPELPAIAAMSAGSADRTSTLELATREGTTYTWRVVRGAGLTMADAAATRSTQTVAGPPLAPHAAAPAAWADELSTVVGNLASGNGTGAAEVLAQSGIGFVLAPASDKALAAALDSTVGLGRAAETGGHVAWRVGDPELPQRAAWLRLVEPDGTWTALDPAALTIPAGAEGRRLVLADQADPGWRATIGGSALTATTDGAWRQAFEVPAAGGRVTLARERDPLVAVQLAVGVLALILCAPGRRRRLSSGGD
jgi:hypothetical protein